MAQCCQQNFQRISRTFQIETCHIVSINNSRKVVKWRSTSLKGRSRNHLILQSYNNSFQASSSTSATDQEIEEVVKDGVDELMVSNENGWKVRRMVETEEEMKNVARIQAEAFHQPVFFFNDMFLQFFQAEVLAGLLYRLRNSPPDRYACLVAEPLSEQDLVGVVDATIFRDKDVLQNIPGADEYIYISGIAVLNKFRRQKVATALLKACDVLARLWGFEYLALRAYDDDLGARRLYESAGYTMVSGDSPWTTTWIGRRRRILMVKNVNFASNIQL